MALIYNKCGDELVQVPQTDVQNALSVEMARYDTDIGGSFWNVLELVIRDQEGRPIHALRVSSDHFCGKENLERLEVTHRKSRIQ